MSSQSYDGETLNLGDSCDMPCPECESTTTYTAYVRQEIKNPSRESVNNPPIGPGYSCDNCGAAWRI